ncbi:hypothetical protein EJB05_42090, partial [Eragrostis curvula]
MSTPGFLIPPPPPRWPVRRSSPPQPWYPTFSPTPADKSSAPPERVIIGIGIGVVASLAVLSLVCRLCQSWSHSQRANPAVAAAAGAASARDPSVAAARPDDDDDCSERRRGSSTAGLPSFTYSQSVKKNLTTVSEEEAATCAVCLGEFRIGETVRLLPACLHLYHVECIDPWLDAHSSCPICRSGTDPAMDPDRLPPV